MKAFFVGASTLLLLAAIALINYVILFILLGIFIFCLLSWMIGDTILHQGDDDW